MRAQILFASFIILIPACGACGRRPGTCEIKDTTSLRIAYFIQGEEKQVEVTIKKEVDEIIQSINMKARRNGVFAGIAPNCRVTFLCKDKGETSVIFIANDMIEEKGVGIILVDTSFYKMICEIVSRVEGSKTDILESK